MRIMVKRGFVSSRVLYKKLRKAVWEEIQMLDDRQQVLHGRDIQEIAMIKAKELGLPEFTVIRVNNVTKLLNYAILD